MLKKWILNHQHRQACLMLLKEKLTVWRKTLAGENFGKLNSSDKLEEKSLGNGLVLPIFKKKSVMSCSSVAGCYSYNDANSQL